METGFVPGGWTYQKWISGVATCFIILDFTTAIQTAVGNGAFYKNTSDLSAVEYPFPFIQTPSEVASVQTPGNLVWIAGAKDGANSPTHTASYTLLSSDKLNAATYKISLQVSGLWK